MKKKSKIEIAREIISNLKIEMNKPRLTESARIGESRLAQTARKPAPASARP
jgi:hypothetical protein